MIRAGIAHYFDYYIGKIPKEPEINKGFGHLRVAFICSYELAYRKWESNPTDANLARIYRMNEEITEEEFANTCLFITDTPDDVKRNVEAGVTVIARTGTVPSEELYKAGATLVVDDFRDLPEIIATL